MPRSLPSLNFAFMGGGNMASAMIPGLKDRGLSADQIMVVDPFAEARSRMQEKHGVRVFESTRALRAHAQTPLDAAIWAVKPNTFPLAAVQANEAGVFHRSTLHMSVMAGTSTDSLSRQMGSSLVVRAMPNQAAAIGQAITGMYAPSTVSAEDRALAEEVMKTLGPVEWVEHEAQMHAVTAISGSGPAYMFQMLKAMREQGERLGLDPDQALRLAVQTMAGSAELARNSALSMDELIAQVRSPNGTTHAALETMDARGVFEGFKAGIQAAHHRSSELASPSPTAVAGSGPKMSHGPAL